MTRAGGVEQLLSQGQRLLAQGEWVEAERALEQAAKAAPGYRWPHLYLALARADGGRAEEALPEIDRALELAPESPVLMVFRARILCDAGRYDAAIETCEEALALDPRYTVARGYQALALLEKGEWAEAFQRWKQAPDEPPTALLGRMLLAAERLAGRHAPHPSSADGPPAGAPSPLLETEGTGGDLPGVPVEKPQGRRVPRAAASALKRARHAYGQEQHAQAQQAYLEAVGADPALDEAWLELAVVSYELGAYTTARQALERYRQAAGLDESDPQSRAYLAGCEAKLGNPEAALELLEGADAKQPVVPYTRGLAMLALDRIPEARHAFIQFAAAMPRLVHKRLEQVRQVLGVG